MLWRLPGRPAGDFTPPPPHLQRLTWPHPWRAASTSRKGECRSSPSPSSPPPPFPPPIEVRRWRHPVTRHVMRCAGWFGIDATQSSKVRQQCGRNRGGRAGV